MCPFWRQTRSLAAQADVHYVTKDSPQLQLLQPLPSVAPRSQPAVGRLWTATRPGLDCAGSHRYQYRADPVHQGTGTPWSQSELRISGALQSTAGSRSSGTALFGCVDYSVAHTVGGDAQRSARRFETRHGECGLETPVGGGGAGDSAVGCSELPGTACLQTALPESAAELQWKKGPPCLCVFRCSSGKGDIGPSLG